MTTERLKIVRQREKLISKQGLGQICPRCSGPVLAMDYDTQLVVFCVPLSHRTKRKFYCTVCSARLTTSA